MVTADNKCKKSNKNCRRLSFCIFTKYFKHQIFLQILNIQNLRNYEQFFLFIFIHYFVVMCKMIQFIRLENWEGVETDKRLQLIEEMKTQN